MAPRVSVLLPVRDGATHLAKCVASLKRQTLHDVEYLAVDDGSTDATRDILNVWAREDPRVRVFRQPPLGLVSALERARAEARSPLLARMDADDVAHPTRLARQLELMDRSPHVALCGCGVEYFPEASVKDGARRYQRWLNGLVSSDQIRRAMMVECPVAHPTFVMRSKAVEDVGGYRDMGWAEDYDLLLRLWEAGASFAKVPDILLRWREGTDRLSRTDPRYSLASFRRAKVDAMQRTLLADRSQVVVWGSGPTGKAFARALMETGQRVSAFVDVDPRKIGQEIHGAPVVEASDIGRFQGAFCVAAVADPVAREKITSALRAAGLREMVDFCAVA